VQRFFLAGRYPGREDIAELYGALQREGPDGASWTLDSLHAALDRPKAKLQVALRLLRHRGVVTQDRDGRLELTRAGLDSAALAQLLLAYRDKRESDRAMLERMVFYGQTGHCRWRVLLDNFGEADGFGSCGTCDNCLRIAAARAAAEDAERVAENGASASAVTVASALPLPALGDRVKVPRYGRGIVEAVDAEGVTVLFAEGSRRVFLPAFVQRLAPSAARPKAAKVTASAARARAR
jgi:ATP-dependent DNA helicase RecQ